MRCCISKRRRGADPRRAQHNPLIPKGRELIATVMFEIDDPAKRAAILGELGGVGDLFLSIDGAEVTATAETDVDRTSAEGKASSVQFVHFRLTDDQAAKLKGGAGEVIPASSIRPTAI